VPSVFALALTEDPYTRTSTVVEGIVTQVGDEEFSVDTGAREILVNVSEMPYNPTKKATTRSRRTSRPPVGSVRADCTPAVHRAGRF